MYSSLLLITIAIAAVALLLLGGVRYFFEKQIIRRLGIEKEVEMNFVPTLMIDFVFVLLIPAILYAALYPILPFSSFRAGLFMALFIFLAGSLPITMRTFNQFKLPASLLAFNIFWNLLTLLVVIGLITHFYQY